MNNKQLGRLGELAFENLCTHGGVNVISSQENDINGWDFFLEIPADINPSVSLDKQQPILESKAQVKATEKNKNGTSMKLSGLLKLAAVPYPVFFCFFEFNNDEKDPTKGYLVHLDKNLIINILERARKAHESGDHENLHKLTKKISYSESEKIDLNDGKELAKKIKSYIGSDYANYLNEKQKLIHSSEYSRYFFRGKLSFKSKDEILQAFLGYTTEIPIKDPEGYEERWGVKLPIINNNDSERAEVTFASGAGTQIKVIFDTDNRKNIIFQGNLYILPKVFADEIEASASRIKLFFLDVLVRNEELTFSTTDFTGQKHSYDDLVNALLILRALSSRENIRCSLLAKGKTSPVVLFDGILPLVGATGKGDVLDYLELLKICKRVVEFYENTLDSSAIVLNELYYQAENIHNFDLILQSNGKGITFKINEQFNISSQLITSVLLVSCCTIADITYLMMTSFTFINESVEIDSGLNFKGDSKKRVEKLLTFSSSSFNPKELNRTLKSIISEMKNRGIDQVEVIHTFKIQ